MHVAHIPVMNVGMSQVCLNLYCNQGDIGIIIIGGASLRKIKLVIATFMSIVDYIVIKHVAGVSQA